VQEYGDCQGKEEIRGETCYGKEEERGVRGERVGLKRFFVHLASAVAAEVSLIKEKLCSNMGVLYMFEDMDRNS